jgi:hypothetical protein
MIGFTILAAVASAQAVTVTDEFLSIGARMDCVIAKPDRVDLRRITFLFPDRMQGTEKPAVLILETDASGDSALYRRTASSVPPPAGPTHPPVYRQVILIDDTPMETLSPATDRGDRWTYDKTSTVFVADGGEGYTLKIFGRCDLVGGVGSQ